VVNEYNYSKKDKISNKEKKQRGQKMKTAKILIALMLTIALAGIAHALPLTIEDVQINDVTLNQDTENALSLQRGEDYEVKLKVSSEEELTDIKIEAFISGYDNEEEQISDSTELFDLEPETTYIKTLKITIPENLETDTYLLRIMATDRDNDELIQNYKLKIDAPRHKLIVKDVIFRPSGEIKAGTSLLATVRLKNEGQKDQKYVKVKISIPQLGIEGTDYIDEIKKDEEQETEEIYMKIPRNAETGTYEAKITAKYSEYKTTSSTYTIKVRADEEYTENPQPEIIITQLTQEEPVKAGETATYPIAITNQGKNSRAVALIPQQTDWAETTLSESTIVLQPEQTQTTIATIKVKKDTPAGKHATSITIIAGENQKQITLTANVTKEEKSLKGILETALIIFIILLVVLGIAMGVTKLQKKEDYY